jgi:predicted DCC family thiol-disulfide oxidoreductase YuxK
MKQHPIILFDGVCNFCNGAINFIIKQDKKGLFRFAALQSGAGQQLLDLYHLKKGDFESFVLLDGEKVYYKSRASLKIFCQLPWYWRWTQVFWIIPKFVRDSLYNIIAKNRYKWFGKKEQCMIPTPEQRMRFLS